MSTAALSNLHYPTLGGFDKRNRELVYAMCDAGWTGRRTSKGHWLAMAPDKTTKITVPAKDTAGRGLKNAQAQFMRWMREHMTDEERDLFDKAKAEDDPLVKDVLADSLIRKQATRVMHERDERIDATIRTLIDEGTIVIEPLIRPWLARKHAGRDGGTLYESETTLERVWPDGRTDYQCAFPRCGWTADKPRSVAMHYGQEHTRKGNVQPASQDGPHHIDPTYTEPLTSREYRPTERLVMAAAEAIRALMDDEEATPESIARCFLEWAHDRPDIEHEPRPLVPLTDKDILNRIRVLVGQPDQSEEIAALQEENMNLANEVARLKDEKAALRDLLSEES